MTEVTPVEPALDAGRSAATGRAARGSAANLSGAVVAAAANFALTIAVTRGMSRPAAGIFFTATSLFLLATSVGQLGTGSGLVYFLARCRALGTPGLVTGYVRAAVRPVVVSGVLMGAVMFVFAAPIAALIIPGHADSTTTYLRVLAIFIPFAGVENVALAASRGMGTMKANVVVEQLGRPVLQLALVVIAVLVSGSGLLGWAWAFGYAPAAVVAWWWWRRLHSRVGEPDAGFSGRLSRDFWRFTAPRSIASVAQQAMQRLDIVLVGALAGAVPAAIYAAATRFIVVGQMGRNAVSLAIQPQLAETLARQDKAATNHLYQISTTWLMAITWPLYLVLAVFGGPLLHVFGTGYNTGALVLLLLSISMLIATLCGDVDVMLIMAGRTSWSLANVTLAFGTNLGLDIWLIPSHGVTGAAIGWAAAIALKNLSALVQIAVVMRLHPFGSMTFTITALCLISYGVVPGFARVLLGSTATGLLTSVFIGTLLYIAGLWTFRDRLELGSLRSLRRSGARPS